MASVEAQLRKLEEQLLQPAIRNNKQLVSSLLRNEFREYGSSGRIWNKEQILDTLRNETSACFSITDFDLTVLSPDAALVTYRAIRHGPSPKNDTASLRCSVWILRDNRWQMLFHQGTPAADLDQL